VLAAVVVADVRQFHLGPLGAVLAARPLRWVGAISYGVYLWHWPIIVYFDQSRTGLSGAELDLARVGLTLAAASTSYYLIERPIRQRRLVGWPRFTLAPAAAVATAAVIVVATVPAVASPPMRAQTTRAIAVTGSRAVPGAGGYQGQVPIRLPAFSRTSPLRVTVFGDSVPEGAEPGIAAALGATGEITVGNLAFGGWGLNRDLPTYTWHTGIPSAIADAHSQLVLATWSWDDSCTPGELDYRTYTCARQRPQAFTKMMETVVRLMLGPGGASGVIFIQYPTTGPVTNTPDAATAAATDATRAAGEAAFDRIVRSLPSVFPGKVMYLPLASAVLLAGQYTTWLPPESEPGAPKAQWVRVRKVDHVHLCPAGVTRYSNALLADLTSIFRLPAAARDWSTQSWTDDAMYNTPPGSCPDDHPPG
jgi:hypothetical protein